MTDSAAFRMSIDRRRDLLVTEGDPRPLHVELELHLLSIGVREDPGSLRLVKDGLSALALWQISRPRFETHGWTISIRAPRVNLFFTGSATEGTVVGRAFHEHLADADRNLFFVQTTRPRGELQTSSVEVEGNDIFSMVEQYARKSDQAPVRLFRREGGRVALVTPLPDADRDLVERAAPGELLRPEDEGDLKAIAESEVAFRCGCDTARLTRILFQVYRGDAGELFRGDPAIEAECPRCGTKHVVVREAFDAAGGSGREPHSS